MSMPLSSLLSLNPAAAAEEALRPMPMPPWVFGVLALVAFAALLGVLWSFRNSGAKHGQHKGGPHGDVGPGSPGSGGHH